MRHTLVALLFTFGLSACGGVVEEMELSTVDQGTGEVKALYACPIDRPCPGTTECVDGLCIDCARYPQRCVGRSGGVSAMGYESCGTFRRPCCPDRPCNYGLECDTTTWTCLH
jgi:hypothetical protein